MALDQLEHPLPRTEQLRINKIRGNILAVAILVASFTLIMSE
jgi:hypothetical protein